MNEILQEVALLLEQFQQSAWRDLYVRNARYSLFIAKAGGGANPLLDATESARGTADSESTATIVRAPHIGTVVSTAQPGAAVTQGSVVCRLQVLDEILEIVSERSGIVETQTATAGSLVEFDAPLLRIAATP